MNIKYLVVLLLIFPSVSLSENVAVQEVNFELFGGYTSNKGRAIDLLGTGSFPIGRYGGAKLSLNSNRSNHTGSYLDSQGNGASGQIFLRNDEIGSLGLGYSMSATTYDALDEDFEIDSNGYSFDAEYYFKRFTMGVQWFSTDARANKANVRVLDSDRLEAVGSWYINHNFKTYLLVGGKDAKDVNGLGVEFLPEALNHRISFSALYYDVPGDHSVTLGVKYFFTGGITLLDRDRRY